MTFGELHDQLKAIAEAERDVEQAERALLNGGSPETISRKQEMLRVCQQSLEYLRDEEITL